MIEPTVRVIRRTGRGVGDGEPGAAPPAWSDVAELLRSGQGTSWLSVRGRDGGVHTRPIFAAWTGASFVFASKATAVKTAHLQADGDVSLAIDLGSLHVVTEGVARRLTTEPDLRRASTAMQDVYGWPTTVAGDELDAEYAAPTSGGPPFQAWELTPRTVLTLPTADRTQPARFTFPPSAAAPSGT